MMLRLLSWNVRGLNDPDKLMVVKFFVKDWKRDIVCIQETKINEMAVSIF